MLIFFLSKKGFHYEIFSFNVKFLFTSWRLTSFDYYNYVFFSLIFCFLKKASFSLIYFLMVILLLQKRRGLILQSGRRSVIDNITMDYEHGPLMDPFIFTCVIVSYSDLHVAIYQLQLRCSHECDDSSGYIRIQWSDVLMMLLWTLSMYQKCSFSLLGSMRRWRYTTTTVYFIAMPWWGINPIDNFGEV